MAPMQVWTSTIQFLWGMTRRAWLLIPSLLVTPIGFYEKVIESVFPSLSGIDVSPYLSIAFWPFVVVGLLSAAVLTYNDVRLKLEKAATDLSERYFKAIEHINAESMATRIAAVTTLEEIAKRSDEYRQRIFAILTAYIRESSPAPPEEGRRVGVRAISGGHKGVSLEQLTSSDRHEFARVEMEKPIPKKGQDIQLVVNILCSLPKPLGYRLDLSETDLSGLVFERGDLERAIFAGATLRRTVFAGARLSNADFDGAILNDSDFSGTVARSSGFAMVRAHRMHLDEADISNASFFGADLYDASMQKAKASGTQFNCCQLWRLSGGLTDFENADFSNALLEGADLSHAKNLIREQLHLGTLASAKINHNSRFPWTRAESTSN